ncbi:MAG: DUF4258 domain-containing protein [Thermodesulforhabdaceae bacterium]
MKLSKHAKLKIEERRIDLENIEKVLKNAELIFYDIISKSFVSIGKIKIGEMETNLIVVHKKEDDEIKIITAYPCKNIDKEIKRKERLKWIRIK